MSVSFDSNVTIELSASFGGTFTSIVGWTDISAYVRSFSVKRGRSHELSQIQPGRLTVVLDNSDGRFDPTYTSGAYYPNVKLNTPIRFRANYNTTDYSLFSGFADGWDMSYPAGGNDSVVTLTASDGFKMFAQAASTTAQTAEQSHTRIGNLLDDANWPSPSGRSLETGDVWCIDWEPPADGSLVEIESQGTRGQSRLAYYSDGSVSVLALMQQVEKTENGTLFMSADGNVVFQNRYFRSLSSSQATYGDGVGELPYANLELGFDDVNMWNRVRVTSALDGAVTQSASDATSITENGLRTLRLSNLLLESDEHAASLALWLRDRWSDPDVYVSRMEVRPQRDPSNLWPRVLGDDISTKLTVKRRPAAGNTITQDVFVDGIEHSATPGGPWVTRYFLSNGEGVYDDYLLLGDVTDGLLNTNKLGY